MADTIVLCGSLGASAAMWDPQEPALRGRRVVRVDHPGHGGSPVTAVRDVDDLARRLLEHVDDDRFSLVGLSLGGAVALRVALTAPARVDRLVLACTSTRFGEPSGWLDRAALVRREGLEAIVDAILDRWFSPCFAERPRYRRMFLATDPEGYARCCEALARWDGRAELDNVRASTLVVVGSDDPSAPPARAHEIAAAVPHAEVAEIAGARHLANVEHADEFNRLLEEHL